jgi:hypothetical protein
MEFKVLIEQRVLRASDGLQRIALVYFGTHEYRVYAPARGIGDPLEWIEQLLVHRSEGFDESEVTEPNRSHLIAAMVRELERTKAEAAQAETDALYCEAQICMQGDVQSSDGTPFNPAGHCTKCGAGCMGRLAHSLDELIIRLEYAANHSLRKTEALLNCSQATVYKILNFPPN